MAPTVWRSLEVELTPPMADLMVAPVLPALLAALGRADLATCRPGVNEAHRFGVSRF